MLVMFISLTSGLSVLRARYMLIVYHNVYFSVEILIVCTVLVNT